MFADSVPAGYYPDPLVDRPDLLNRLDALADTHLIKVISGVRRGGKSVLLELFRRRLRSRGVAPEQLVVIDLDLLENAPLRTAEALHAHVLQHLVPDATTYVFIDEVQRCEHFEDAIESLYARPGVDLYITGSNASLLSGELATLLSGRFIQTLVLPLSYAERHAAPDHAAGGATDLGTYARWGGFPELIHLPDPLLKDSYLEGVFNTVLLRDVAERHAIRDTVALRRIAQYLFENIGSLISPSKIAGAFTAGRYKISRPTVESYIAALTDAHLFYEARRFDLRGKALLTGPAKYYAVDTGLRNYAVGYRGQDTGHLLENLVYLELRRRGYQVMVGALPGGEIDFIASREGIDYYVQVCQEISTPATRDREITPLQTAPGQSPRLLLTYDPLSPDTIDGIPCLNITQWLLGRTSLLQ